MELKCGCDAGGDEVKVIMVMVMVLMISIMQLCFCYPSESPLQNMLDGPPEMPASVARTPDEKGQT